MKKAAALALLLAPSFALAAAPELEVSQKATIGGQTVPIRATVSSDDGVTLSESKQSGAVPVTIIVYVTPKPKPAATSSAAVESSQNIQNGIANFSPQAAQTVAPFFTLVDGGRIKAADALQSQLTTTKKNLGADAGEPGAVLSAESSKNAVSNPMGSFWYILRTLYLYVLTILLFLVSSAGIFYPLLAIIVLYMLWRVFKRFRRA